jgi:exodeoxyribonuclease VII large subunit
VVPDDAELMGELMGIERLLARAHTRRVDTAKAEIQWHASALRNRLLRAAERGHSRVAALGGRLNALSPLATLSRGYGVARAEDGRALTSISGFRAEMPFSLVLRDGTVRARTIDTTGNS